MSKEFYTLKDASAATGFTIPKLKQMALDGLISLINNKISSEDIMQIIREQQSYISFLEYARSRVINRFDGTRHRDRDILLDYLELNNWFEIDTFDPEDMLYATEQDLVLFPRENSKILDEKLLIFFEEFDLSEKEKIEKLFAKNGSTSTVEDIRNYFNLFLDEQKFTPSHVEFVRQLIVFEDIAAATDEQLQVLFAQPMPVSVKNMIVQFLNHTKRQKQTQYGNIVRNKKESQSAAAYSDDTYLALASCVFNAEYIHEHNMIKKALDNHIFAELWLYIAIFYACGWRAGDVCSGWRYPKLHENGGEMFGIHCDTLYDDILEDRIESSVYEKVCEYSITNIEISGQLPSKTAAHNPSTLLAVITPELRPFYGLLTLIAECHMLRSGDGYMRKNRTTSYQNRMTLAAFFGDKIKRVLNNRNLHTRRLNKDFLQGVEENARKTGCGGVLASAVASYARNHTDLSTIKSYLKDHNLTNETAETVLYFIMERGVFGFEYYQALITAYPDAVRSMPLAEQNKLIALANVSPLALEQKMSGLLTEKIIREDFVLGNEDSVLAILKNMFEISQMRGKSKEHGIYCLLRANKKACEHPEWDSCLANCCPHLVFTKHGYLPLVQVLKRFYNEAAGGNAKAAAILKQIIIPRYQSIINQLMRNTGMGQKEKNGLKLLLEMEVSKIDDRKCSSQN